MKIGTFFGGLALLVCAQALVAASHEEEGAAPTTSVGTSFVTDKPPVKSAENRFVADKPPVANKGPIWADFTQPNYPNGGKLSCRGNSPGDLAYDYEQFGQGIVPRGGNGPHSDLIVHSTLKATLGDKLLPWGSVKFLGATRNLLSSSNDGRIAKEHFSIEAEADGQKYALICDSVVSVVPRPIPARGAISGVMQPHTSATGLNKGPIWADFTQPNYPNGGKLSCSATTREIGSLSYQYEQFAQGIVPSHDGSGPHSDFIVHSTMKITYHGKELPWGSVKFLGATRKLNGSSNNGRIAKESFAIQAEANGQKFDMICNSVVNVVPPPVPKAKP